MPRKEGASGGIVVVDGARKGMLWGLSRALLATAVLVLFGAASGCGSSGDVSQEQLDQARREGAGQQKLKDQQAQLRKDIEALKKEREASRTSTSGSSSGASGTGSSGQSGGSSNGGSPPSSAASCGEGVSAG